MSESHQQGAPTAHHASEAAMIQVLIVEDLPILLAGLRMRLSAEPDLIVIGGASDFETGLDLAKRCSPDVVVLDVDPPCVDSVITISEVRQLCQVAPVVILAMNDSSEVRTRLREAGAAAFVAKLLPVSTLVTTIRQVAKETNAGRGHATHRIEGEEVG